MLPDRLQLRAARAELKLTLFEAAGAVGLQRSRLASIESGTAGDVEPDLIRRLAEYYEAAGIVFGSGPGVRLRAGLQMIGGKKVH